MHVHCTRTARDCVPVACPVLVRTCVPCVEQALKHPYMASFYTGKEPKCPGVLTVPIDDDHKFTVTDYRERLYSQVVANKKDRGARMAAYFGGAKN